MMANLERKSVSRWWISRAWDRVVLFLTTRMFTLAIALMMGLKSQERMSHNNGIAGRGVFEADPDPRIPDHVLFSKGNRLPCRIRHAAATFYDDAMSAIRSISVKLSDERWKSPFDLELNTGSIGLFWNATSFLKLASMRGEKYGIEYEEYYKQYPIGKEGARRTLRRDPTSFANLIYYNKTPLYFIGGDGVVHYAKYRVVPFYKVPETGKVEKNSTQWIEPQNQRIDPVARPFTRNYLKEEFAHRVRKQVDLEDPVRYRLEVQLRKHSDDQDPIIFNCCVDWPESEYPWMQLGVLTIRETLDWAESNLTTFSFRNLPRSLGVIPAKSLHDYNSLNYMRKNIDFAKKARLWSYKIKGMPPEIPDDDFRNAHAITDPARH